MKCNQARLNSCEEADFKQVAHGGRFFLLSESFHPAGMRGREEEGEEE